MIRAYDLWRGCFRQVDRNLAALCLSLAALGFVCIATLVRPELGSEFWLTSQQFVRALAFGSACVLVVIGGVAAKASTTGLGGEA